jgi:hypothetical protein
MTSYLPGGNAYGDYVTSPGGRPRARKPHEDEAGYHYDEMSDGWVADSPDTASPTPATQTAAPEAPSTPPPAPVPVAEPVNPYSPAAAAPAAKPSGEASPNWTPSSPCCWGISSGQRRPLSRIGQPRRPIPNRCGSRCRRHWRRPRRRWMRTTRLSPGSGRRRMQPASGR